MECFTLQNLSFAYPDVQDKTLNDLSFTVQAGEFVTLCGPSGCGKTTLLRQFKPALAPHGVLEGTILFEGKPLYELSLREQSSRIGFVLQNPDNQIVTDKVWHELAFGLESLGYDTPTIRRRVAEVAAFFGAVYAGCFYVPLDPEMPPARMESILESVDAKLLIVDKKGEKIAKLLEFALAF